MRRDRPAALLTAALFSAGLTASAREVLTPEEQAERELEAKKRAPPVLVVEPDELTTAGAAPRGRRHHAREAAHP